MGLTGAAAVIGVGISAYSAVKSNDNAREQQATADKALQDTENQAKKTDEALALQQQKNLAKQQQDASWLGMRTQANKMAGIAGTAPGSLTSQTGSMAGFTAGTKAGNTLLGA